MVKLILPVYWVNEKKTKPSTTHLLGMNWYRNAHYFAQNAAKKMIQELVELQLEDAEPIKGQYKMTYTYFYKNKSSDLMNVVSLMSKFTNDALQEYGVVFNDNVQYCVKEVALVGEQDVDIPRCEILVEEVK